MKIRIVRNQTSPVATGDRLMNVWADAASVIVKKKPKKSRFLRHVEPKEPYTVGNQLRRVIPRAWINLLLPFAIVGIVFGSVLGPTIIAFAVNFVAIVPLGFMAEYGLDEICLRVGGLVGGLIYISTRFVPRLLKIITRVVQIASDSSGL